MENAIVRYEKMSDIFHKLHVENLGFNLTIHKFDKPESADADCHDHPYDIQTTILDGGYIEVVYYVRPDGRWHYDYFLRKKGETHVIKAETIHKIVGLTEGVCHTAITYGEPTRKSRIWRFDTPIAKFREWDQREFQYYTT